MVKINRWLRHALTPPWRWRVAFSKDTLSEISLAIQKSERQHGGELRFVVENTLASGKIWQGISARQRGIELFAQLGVWDTEANSGVLIYLLLADREVHIIADRGIAKQVGQAQWDAIAAAMQSAFAQRDFKTGALHGIAAISDLLVEHFPATADKENELPDYPVII